MTHFSFFRFPVKLKGIVIGFPGNLRKITFSAKARIFWKLKYELSA